MVVDQMCWEYLSKFKPYFAKNGGFNRLLNNGANCVNTHIPYLPTITACGHTCVYTGSVPAFHGIAGNVFWDNINQKQVYCTEDNTVKSVGDVSDKNGKMSPKNLWASTIADQLRLFNNFKNKSFGISIKDRGAILPAGQSANAAYWYDPQTGNFITSTYYQNQLPNWLIQFNNQKKVNEYYKKNWHLSLPINIYQQLCDEDNNGYENNPFNANSNPIFPYILDSFVDKDFSKISSTPFANDLLVDLAQKLIIEENLGKNKETDFLSISFSSPDYIGHSFGPNSFEQLDDYIKLDLTLARLFSILDNNIGINNYTLFLTADHAVSPIPAYLNKHHINANTIDDKIIKKEIYTLLDKEKINHNIISAVIEN
ncbi:MAG: alkaline phosphatase family protein, partial [Sediminibacterium sp.]|nr:alkaline phosphatase family protein [Sediminibacterium sp.]